MVVNEHTKMKVRDVAAIAGSVEGCEEPRWLVVGTMIYRGRKEARENDDMFTSVFGSDPRLTKGHSALPVWRQRL